jgi:organic radical activating enzyme
MPNGNISLCGHMVNPQSFNTLEKLENSSWLNNLKKQFDDDQFPNECIRCKQEELGKKSVRQHANDRDKILSAIKKDYLIVGGILDNICNSACQFCNEDLSTKIGSLMHGKNYRLVNNVDAFSNLPQDRIVELDINGGEPSNSPNYLKLLQNLPTNIKIVRINTNASRYISEIEKIINNDIKVIVTISLDGISSVYEYARWPLSWDKFNETVDKYIELRGNNKLLSLDFWTTISAYTIGDFNNIKQYAKEKHINFEFGLLQAPDCLQIKYKNPLTLRGINNLHGVAVDRDNTNELLLYLQQQDKLRGTNFENCYNWS